MAEVTAVGVDPPEASPPVTRREGLAVALAALALLAWLVPRLDDVGFPVDEPYYARAGELQAGWLLDPPPPATDPAAARDAAFAYNHEHPPLAKLLFGLSRRALAPALGLPAAWRLPSALLFVALAVALYAAARPWGRTAAATAALCLVTSPHHVGHALIAGLDGPAAALCFLAVLAFHRAGRGPSQALLAGVVLGLALATKLNALLLPAGFALWTWRWRPREARPLAAVLLVAPATLVAVWPWLWREPLARLAEYILFHARQWLAPVWYLGVRYQDPPAPWHYPFVLAAASLPLPVVVLILAGIARHARDRFREPLAALALVQAALAFLAVARPGQGKYDGIRIFLHAFPLLFLAAAIGLEAAASWLRRRVAPEAGVFAAPALLAAVFVPLLLEVHRVHPHQLSYYGGLVGGIPGAHRRGFESNMWGGHRVNREVVAWANRNLPRGATIDKDSAAFGALAQHHAIGHLRPDLRFIDDGRYWFLECSQGWASGQWWWELYEDRHRNYRRIHTFTVDGVPAVNVFERR